MQEIIDDLEKAVAQLVLSRSALKAKLSLAIHKRPMRKLQDQAIFEWGIKTGLEITIKKLKELEAKKALTEKVTDPEVEHE
jgi:hypothetical protein